MRLLVCGSRNYDNFSHVCDVLDVIALEYPDLHIIHGGADGVDTNAGEWAYMNNKPCTRYPALWYKHGKAAGPIRNKQMIDDGKPDKVLAFLAPNSRGTKNMIEQSTEANIPVRIIEISN